jgi:glucokinase
MQLIGIDIGGTKCAVSLGYTSGDGTVEIIYKCGKRLTAKRGPDAVLPELLEDVRTCISKATEHPVAIGISCGGPLDSRKGLVLSPPNLPGWDEVPVVEYFAQATGIPTYLCNDANAGALAEWRMGAGKGCSNMVFMTFGTGLGAGLILNSELYEGTSDSAGELGHIRLAPTGPVGYHKAGSFEGFCSGGGIAQLAKNYVAEELEKGNVPALCPTMDAAEQITAETVCKAAKAGDELALRIMRHCGTMLGAGLSIVMDILNPEKIIIGSIFARAGELLWPNAEMVINEEALEETRSVCCVVPSSLNESVGDIAALTVAEYYWSKEQRQ